ncbi:DUF3397 domain-containing protein [Vagococcus acidifermentans]|uniref:DUF3397 domain-containing protein n=1 Tax=Vagococcus acidifermentans TaxID=564710 RepID=A0A430AWN8_9ENTE|nr:DUF3397 domain-containing protein [Vagococcus acidifermentans]RSU12470.1 hypothetical protein CBF27_05705 [Vagococcus acidifermentans]
MNSLSVTVFLWYIFPVILMFACNFIVTTLSLSERLGIKSPDIATPFLFIGLHFLSVDTIGASILPYMILISLMLGMVVAVYQASTFKEIKYKRYIKMLWRIIFLVTLLIYIVLIVMSIINYL